jgi:hypothetical protein
MKDPRIPKGVKAMAFVGFRAQEIGESSVLDDPEQARWLEQMGRGFREKMNMP